MFLTTRADLGAGNISEDEEASLVKERDRTLRTALDQIQQQRRRAPPLQPPNLPSSIGVVEHQFKDCEDGGDAVEATVDSETASPTKPSPSQGPLEALRQREWLLNLQEQQELQSLKVALSSLVKQDFTLEEKEEQLLFNGEVPPLLPVQSSAPATCTTTVSSTSSASTPRSITTSTLHSTCTTTTSSTTGSTNSMRARTSRATSGNRGRGRSRSRPQCVHHNSRGGPLHHREQHGGRWSQERRAKEIPMPQGRENTTPKGRESTTPKGRENSTPQGRENATAQGREKPVQQTGQASSERGHANSPKKTTELPSWQQKATPLSVQDEAAMLAQAIELSHLDSAADSKLEEEQLRIVLEQSRQEAQRRRRGGGGNHRRGASRSGRRGLPGRGGGTAESRPQASFPPHQAEPPDRHDGFTIVGSIDAGPLTSGAKFSSPLLHQVPPRQPPLLPPPPPPPHRPPPPPPSSAEPAVSFDQWLSMCSHYMPLLTQSMVELQRTCAAMRSVAPSLERSPLLLSPPLWSPHFPPPAAQSPLSPMTPPPLFNPAVNPPMNSPVTSPMGPPSPVGSSHVAPLDASLLAAAASAFQCLPPPVRQPRPVRGASHSASLQQKNLQHDRQQMPPAALFGDKRQQQHSNEQVHVGGHASGDASHRLHHKNAQHHPHQQPPPAAANAGRKQPHTELVQGAKQSSGDAGHRQHQKPAQQQPQQPPATNTVNKLRTSEQGERLP